MGACCPGVTGRKAKKPAYFAGFFGFFFGALRGDGGIASIRRSTSSIGCDSGLGFSLMAGV